MLTVVWECREGNKPGVTLNNRINTRHAVSISNESSMLSGGAVVFRC